MEIYMAMNRISTKTISAIKWNIASLVTINLGISLMGQFNYRERFHCVNAVTDQALLIQTI